MQGSVTFNQHKEVGLNTSAATEQELKDGIFVELRNENSLLCNPITDELQCSVNKHSPMQN